MKIVLRLGEGSVREVRDEFLRDRPLAYTTVMTILDRLARRGCVSRRKVGRTYRYAPLLDWETVRRRAVSDLVRDYFEGSADRLRVYLEGVTLVSNKDEVPDPVRGEERLDASLL